MQRDVSYFLLRRVHTLIGIFSLGSFIFLNLIVGTMFVKNPIVFEAWRNLMTAFPLLRAFEIFLIIIPVLFYVLYGLTIAYNGSSNTIDYSFHGNWMCFLNRLASVLLAIFVLYHIYAVHLHIFIEGEYVGLEYLKNIFSSKTLIGFYIIGAISTLFHYCHIWRTFLMSFGITTSHVSRRFVSIKSWILFFAMVVWSMYLIVKLA